MRLVKIKLADCPFWFLGKLVSLTQQHPVSDFINVDSLLDEDKLIINRSVGRGEVRIYDFESRRMKDLNEIVLVNGEYAVDIEDIKEDQSNAMPEVFSMTVEDETEQEEDEYQGPTETDYQNAQLLLNKNGNTVRKTIKEIPKTDEGLLLLHACLDTEKTGRNRVGIVTVIEQCIMES